MSLPIIQTSRIHFCPWRPSMKGLRTSGVCWSEDGFISFSHFIIHSIFWQSQHSSGSGGSVLSIFFDESFLFQDLIVGHVLRIDQSLTTIINGSLPSLFGNSVGICPEFWPNHSLNWFESVCLHQSVSPTSYPLASEKMKGISLHTKDASSFCGWVECSGEVITLTSNLQTYHHPKTEDILL